MQTTINTKAVQFMKECEAYIDQLIDYEAINFPSAKSLANHPETMDQFMSYYRIRDMCFSYLIDNTARKIGHNLYELDPNQIKNFFVNYDPASLFDFFNQENIINDFIAENELGQKNWFKNDTEYQTAYQGFISKL